MPKLVSLGSTQNRYIIAAVGLILIGAVIFYAMADSVYDKDDFFRFDQPVLDFIYTYRSPLLTAVMEFITNLLAPFSFALFVSVGCATWIWRRRELWRPFLLMTAMCVAMITSVTIKQIVERTRPPHDFMVAPFELDYSFPSGHTIGIAVFVFVLSYLLYSRRLETRHALLWVLSGLFLIALIAFSRLYLAYHWLTDVTASVGLGLIILGIVIIIDQFAPERFKRWSLK